MKAASSGRKRFRSLGAVLGVVVLGTAGLVMVLFLLSGSAVNAAPPIPVRYTPTDGHHTRNPSVEFAWEDVGAPTYTLQLGSNVYTLTTPSYVTGLAEGTYGEIASLVIAEAQRGRGIGRQLVEHAARWLREKGMIKLRVRCNVVRKGAHRFYDRLGFDESKSQKVFDRKLA